MSVLWFKQLWNKVYQLIPLKVRSVFGGKLDFEKLRTSGGNRVIVVLEKDEMADLMKSRHTHNEFQNLMRRNFDSKVGISQNEVVYLLINTDYEGRGLSQDDFLKWEKDKDWFHEETLVFTIIGSFDTLGSGFQFAEPTDEEFIEFCKNLQETISFLDKNSSVCRYCIKKQCPIRTASFDAAALRKAIAAEKTSEKTPG